MVQRTIGLFCIVVFVVSLLSLSACTRSRVKDDELYDEETPWEGRLISIEFQDAHIHSVLRIFAEVTNTNIVAHPQVLRWVISITN